MVDGVAIFRNIITGEDRSERRELGEVKRRRRKRRMKEEGKEERSEKRMSGPDDHRFRSTIITTTQQPQQGLSWQWQRNAVSCRSQVWFCRRPRGAIL
jgi:hypothetical protein